MMVSPVLVIYVVPSLPAVRRGADTLKPRPGGLAHANSGLAEASRGAQDGVQPRPCWPACEATAYRRSPAPAPGATQLTSSRASRDGTLVQAKVVRSDVGHNGIVDSIEDGLAGLVGGDLDMVSFVRNYVEFRVDYSVLRCMTGPIVRYRDSEHRFPGLGSRDALCDLISTNIEAVDENDMRISLRTSRGHELLLPLDTESRTLADGRVMPEAVHLMPSDRARRGGAEMSIW